MSLAKTLQKTMHYPKKNNAKISVRAFHPRLGSDQDFKCMVSYITDKKYKDEDPDPNGPLVLSDPCLYCGRPRGECDVEYCGPRKDKWNERMECWERRCCHGHCAMQGHTTRCYVTDII